MEGSSRAMLATARPSCVISKPAAAVPGPRMSGVALDTVIAIVNSSHSSYTTVKLSPLLWFHAANAIGRRTDGWFNDAVTSVSLCVSVRAPRKTARAINTKVGMI